MKKSLTALVISALLAASLSSCNSNSEVKQQSSPSSSSSAESSSSTESSSVQEESSSSAESSSSQESSSISTSSSEEQTTQSSSSSNETQSSSSSSETISSTISSSSKPQSSTSSGSSSSKPQSSSSSGSSMSKPQSSSSSSSSSSSGSSETQISESGMQYQTADEISVKCVGQYINWDGVTNVAQFVGSNGDLSFAYDGDGYVTVVNTSGGKVLSRVKLAKKHPLFGTVTCDNKGNYYLVTGETNEGENTSKETVFISKYDKNGSHIKTTGDNGSSSLAYYYDNSFYTKIPFSGGNCDAAVNGNILTVNYARKMYSGHQSNSVFTVNTDTMEKINIEAIYNSHSFAQRVVPYKNSFVYLSEGDAYPRAFTISTVNLSAQSAQTYEIFHFWIKSNSGSDMYLVNNNFAHTGGIVNIGDRKIAHIGKSVKSLNEKASSENEQIFIQIFDPDKDLNERSAYFTSGERSGISGFYGDESVTDYGVKWLTNFGANSNVQNPQVVAVGNKIVVLYELYESNAYKGVYYMVLDENGKVILNSTLFSQNAKLNSCEMPVYANGKVCWVQNSLASGNKNLYIYTLDVD